jgi:hypothetical protein
LADAAFFVNDDGLLRGASCANARARRLSVCGARVLRGLALHYGRGMLSRYGRSVSRIQSISRGHQVPSAGIRFGIPATQAGKTRLWLGDASNASRGP